MVPFVLQNDGMIRMGILLVSGIGRTVVPSRIARKPSRSAVPRLEYNGKGPGGSRTDTSRWRLHRAGAGQGGIGRSGARLNDFTFRQGR